MDSLKASKTATSRCGGIYKVVSVKAERKYLFGFESTLGLPTGYVTELRAPGSGLRIALRSDFARPQEGVYVRVSIEEAGAEGEE